MPESRPPNPQKSNPQTPSDQSLGEPAPYKPMDGSAAVGDEPSDGSRVTAKRIPLKRILVVGVIAATLIGVAQWFAPAFDYQIANMITMVALILFVLYSLVVLQRSASSRGRTFLVPGVTVGAIALLLGLFRFEGFSGDLWPQFQSRFASESRGLWQETPESSSESTAAERVIPEAFASSDSPQFLGPNRNGVIEDRLFAIPKSDADVKVLWDQPVGDGWSSFAVAGDRAITMEQRDAMECVTCYRLSDGKLLWIDEHEARQEKLIGGIGPRSTPTIADGNVYAMGAIGFLRVLDLNTGRRVWTKDVLAEANWTTEEFSAAAPWGHASSPLLIEPLGLTIIGFGALVEESALDDEGMTESPKSLIAFDWKTGDVKWKAGRDQLSYASPMWLTLDGQQQIVSVNEKTISGHLAADGEMLWEFSWPGTTDSSANCAAVMQVGPKRFVVGKGYGGGSALVEVTKDANGQWTATEVWVSSRVLKTKFTHTLVAGDVGYAISNGTLQAVDLTEGKPYWNQSRGDRFGQGQVLLVDDVLVAQTETGDVVFAAADTEKYRELGRLEALDSKTWNIPTVAGRHLMVRNDRQAICYLLPEKE